MLGAVFESLPELQKNYKQISVVKAFIQKVFGAHLAPITGKRSNYDSRNRDLLAQRKKHALIKSGNVRMSCATNCALGYQVQDKK